MPPSEEGAFVETIRADIFVGGRGEGWMGVAEGWKVNKKWLTLAVYRAIVGQKKSEKVAAGMMNTKSYFMKGCSLM